MILSSDFETCLAVYHENTAKDMPSVLYHASATRPGVNRAAQALRLAAKNLQRSQSALGAFFRRIAARRGLAKAITATAYKLARIVYALLKQGTAYVAQGLAAYETAYRQRSGKLLSWVF
jgi:hypothetical protein